MKKTKLFHKILAFTLILSILFSMFVFGPVTLSATAEGSNTNTEEIEYWSGKAADDFAGGSGTIADPFLIDNGEQLYLMVKVYSNAGTANGSENTKTYFKLRKDIYLNKVTDADLENPTVDSWNAKGFNPWFTLGGTSQGFCGDFDGNGHTIHGLYAYGGYAALIPLLADGGNVHNVNLKNSFIYGNTNGGAAGGIVGYVYSYWKFSPVTVSNCLVDNIVVDGGSARTGGIVGGFYNIKVTVTNCAVTNTTLKSHSESYPDYVSGIVGCNNSSESLVSVVTNCYTDDSVHPVNATSDKTNFDIIDDKVTYTNVYTSATKNFDADEGVTYLTEAQMKGDAAKTNMQGFDFLYQWKVVADNYPVPNQLGVWDGTLAKNYAGGSGTKADPYLIENGAQLLKMVKESTAKTSDASSVTNNYFKIVNDIYLNPVTAEDMAAPTVDAWTAKGYTIWDGGYRWSQSTGFCGTIDGDGHTIYGLYVDSGCYSGFLANVVGNATVTNLHFKNAFVRGASNGCSPAVIIGAVNGNSTVRSTATVTNCTVDNGYVFSDHTGSWRNGIVVGGGFNEGKITVSNCAVTNCTGVITNTSTEKRTAAFIGNTNYTKTHLIENCFTDSSMHPVTDATTEANYNTIHDNKNYVNVYTSAAQPSWDTNGDITYLTEDQMKGEAAKENMPGLDYDRYWKIVANDYPETRVYNSPSDVWDGKSKASSLDEFDGNGTVDDPYKIETAAQLAYVVTTNLEDGLYFELVNDIKINDTFGEKWKNHAHEWVQNTGIRAVLNLDGNGHTIDGLYFNSSKARMGLFAYIGDSVVKNIKFTNASINHTGSGEGIAIVAGQTSATSTFETIYIDETCEINAPSATGVAAIAARGYTVTNGGVTESAGANILNCAVLADITGGSAVGAFAGTYWYSGAVVTVNGCFTNTTLPIRGNSNGTTNAKNNYALAADDYGTNVLASANLMKGEAARTNMPGLVFGAIWETVEDGYPVIVKNPIEAWDGTAAEEFAGGSGTAEDPFLIENGGQLYKMVSEYSNMNVARKPADQDNAQPHFRITKDINLGNNEWYKIKYSNVDNLTNANFKTGFNGVIYGDGHTIYGLNVNGSYAYPVVALIPVATQGAEIYDLQMSYGTAKSNGWNGRSAAALIGLAVGYPSSKSIIIDRCSVENFNIESKYGSAGLVGYIYAQSVSITNSYIKNTNLSVTATDDTQGAGAFIAVARGNSEGNKVLIENCYSDDVSSTIRFLEGGIDTVTSFNNVYTLDSLYDGTSVAGLNKVNATQLQGVNAKETLVGFNFNQVWVCGEEGEYPVHKACDPTVWNGRTASSYAGGNGTEAEPYEIATAEQLYKLANADTESTKGKYYKLTADITISNIYDGWANDNPYTWAKKTAYLTGFTYGNSFAGTLDGDGHTVTGLYIDENITNGGTYAYGLIPFISANAVVKNVNIDKVKIDVNGNAYVGAVVGAAYSKQKDATDPLNSAQIVGINITNCDITTDNAETTGDVIGGAVGGVKVEQCNQASKPENVITYNANNFDETAIVNIRDYLLGKTDTYITDINAKEGFNVCDLLCAKKSLLNDDQGNSDEYEVVWSQDFNGSELDYSVWSRNTTMSRGATIKYGDLNNVNGESLTLYCEDTNTTNDEGNKIYNVNYGLDTMNSMSFKYGKLTMRAKLPLYGGAFPSLWLTSNGAIGNKTLTTYGTEIDIFEVFGNGDYDFGDDTWNHNQLVACIHKWYNDENGNKIGTDCSCGTSSDAGNNYIIDEGNRSTYINDANKWYIIEFEWDENKMTCSVTPEDGSRVEYYSVTRAEIEGKFGLTDKDYSAEGIFDQFLAIRLNNHMYTKGGAYDYSTKFYAPTIDASKLNYEIDYIKLEQKNDGKSQINLK